MSNSKTKIITVTSGKGGVGKSTSSVNVATVLVEMGFKVCVVDFDVGFLNYELNTCGKESLKNEKIDTVSIAREKFPGQSVSLDALCKRFAIDNTQREKHSATVDTELLARVYIELMDARELSLDLNNSVEVKNSPVTFNTEKIKNRNLPSRLSEKEKELHQSFIQTLGKNSIWNKISQSSE